jgi:hypothetical protein
MARLPIPDASKLREAEKLIKELFKEEYARKAPGERQALSKRFLEQAKNARDDAAAAYVLFREAQDVAAQAGYVREATLAADESSRVFDLDPMALKNVAITASAKAARTPEDFGALTEALIKLAGEYVAADQYEAADKAMTTALGHARKCGDVPLSSRATARAKEVAEAKTRFQAMKRTLETLAKNPEDPAANLDMGQFAIFVKGNWDLGIRYLAKGSDPNLKALASKELLVPPLAELVPIADAWWDLGEKEKSALRKAQLTAHAAVLYELALPATSGLARMKIEKRLNVSDETKSSNINLLRLIDPAQDSLSGDWAVDGGNLLTPSPPPGWCRLQIPHTAPAEYDLTISVRAVEGCLGIRLGLPLGADRQCMVVLGGDQGRSAGLEMIDGRSWNDNNPTLCPMPEGLRSATITSSFRKGVLIISVDGKKLIEWKESGRLSNFVGWQTPNRNCFFLASDSPRVAVTQLLLTPVTGQGKRLR